MEPLLNINAIGGLNVNKTDARVFTGILTTGNPGKDYSYNVVINDWMKASHDLMNYSWIETVNTSVLSAQKAEIAATNKSISEVGNHIMKAKYMNLMTRRDTEMLAAKTRLVRRTMVAISISAIVVNARSLGGWRMPIMAVVALSYMVYALLSIKLARARRYDDYSTIYFNEGAVSTAKTAAATNESGNGQSCNA